MACRIADLQLSPPRASSELVASPRGPRRHGPRRRAHGGSRSPRSHHAHAHAHVNTRLAGPRSRSRPPEEDARRRRAKPVDVQEGAVICARTFACLRRGVQRDAHVRHERVAARARHATRGSAAPTRTRSERSATRGLGAPLASRSARRRRAPPGRAASPHRVRRRRPARGRGRRPRQDVRRAPDGERAVLRKMLGAPRRRLRRDGARRPPQPVPHTADAPAPRASRVASTTPTPPPPSPTPAAARAREPTSARHRERERRAARGPRAASAVRTSRSVFSV